MALKKVAVAEVKRFMTECMNAVGTPAAHSNALAELLLAADVRGHYSHGLNRLEMYVRDIQNNICDGHAVPTILKENTSTAWVSGNNGLGPVVGNFCMNLAIQKAHQSGVGWVAAKNSNHYGMAAWYSMQAIKHGMMGITCSNTSPLMSPTRSKCAALGTNPISFATPALITDDSIVLDMATTTVSLGKIEIQRRKGEKIPDSWAQGPDGLPTVDAEVAYNTRCLMPLGGPEEKSGYKGYGLALIIEALSGLAADSAYGPNIRQWTEADKIANIGHCFIAVDISNCFAPNYKERVTNMGSVLRNLPVADDAKKVMVPGDPERNNEKKTAQENGICYSLNQITSCENLANELGVKNIHIME